MAVIFSSEMHGNDNASIEFGAALSRAVQQVREQMAILAESKKADEYAPGAIHALRKLCEGEKYCSSVYKLEVEEWQATFLAWFERVKKRFPGQLGSKFLTQAKHDFQVLLKASNNMPEFLWRSEVPRRYVQISFPDQHALDAAREAAETNHPVPLGSALHKYLEACVSQLESPSPTEYRKQADPVPNPEGLRLCLWAQSRTVSLVIDDFACFNRAENEEQDIQVTAYDLEEAVTQYFQKKFPKLLAHVKFDCESSMFVARSSNPQAVSTLLIALVNVAARQGRFPLKKKNWE